MEDKRIEIDEALEIAVNTLKGIKVSIDQIDTIGAPICSAIRTINACIEAYKTTNKVAQEAE